ncbi:MAG: phage holin family protein [Clostridium sp.]
MSIQVCVTGLVAYLSQKLGVTFYLLGILLCLMVIDYLSGMAASAVEALDHPDDKSYGWSSRKGAKGIAKKVAYLFVIAVGMVIDYVIIQTSGVLGFNLPNTMLSLLVTEHMYEYSGLCNRLGCIFKSEIRSNLLSSGHFALPDGDRLPFRYGSKRSGGFRSSR